MERKDVKQEKMERLDSGLFTPLTIEESKRLVGGRWKQVTKTLMEDGSFETDDFC